MISLRKLYVILMAMMPSVMAMAQHPEPTVYSNSIVARQAAVESTVARQWNDVLLEAIRGDFARPTVHARNLFHCSVACFDAFAAYDNVDTTIFLGRTWQGFECDLDPALLTIPGDAQGIREAQEMAMSYAAYRLLSHRFASSPSANETEDELDLLMAELGYNANNTSTDYSLGAAELGNYIGEQLIAFGLQDGANESGGYANLYYTSANADLELAASGNSGLTDPNSWQPLSIPVFVDQSGNVLSETPDFLGAEWGGVQPFALADSVKEVKLRGGQEWPVYLDCGAPPLYGEGEEVNNIADEYAWGFAMVGLWSEHLDPADGVMVSIDPGNLGNLDATGPASFATADSFYNWTEGGDFSNGHALNPATGQPYVENQVLRGDYTRVLAEFWADGPESETPPGHWFVLLNGAMDHPDFTTRWEGTGEALDPLRYTVRAYLTLGGAMHDAAIAAWGHKGYYDYIRPVSALRYMAELGQRTDSTLASYHPGGLPLLPGRIEVIEAGDPLAWGGHVGKIKIKAWRGPDAIINPVWDEAGVGWILCEEWWPYQRPSFVTPPFAGYVSGHSTFSRAAAEVLTAITGDPFFPGGMGVFALVQNQFLVFEDGPSQSMELQWATYRDASDQCSLSRIWGGIHPPADDFPGRQLGKELAEMALERAGRQFGVSPWMVWTCQLDLDTDGVVGATDLLMALADFGESGTELEADVNADGVVGVNDILDLLSMFGETCAN